MNANQVKNMVTRVPNISRSIDLKQLNVSPRLHCPANFYLVLQVKKGADLRLGFAALCILPFMGAADTTGIWTAGFSSGTQMESEYKMRPDYATGTLFAAERKDVPTFKQL